MWHAGERAQLRRLRDRLRRISLPDSREGGLIFWAKGAKLLFRATIAGKAGLLRPFLAHGIRGRFSHPEMRRLLDSIGPEDMLTPEELRALSMPTLLLWGREERILPADNLEFFRTHMPDHAEIEEWSDFGHCGFLERPERVARRIVGFARSTVPTQHRLRVSTRVGNRDTLRISA